MIRSSSRASILCVALAFAAGCSGQDATVRRGGDVVVSEIPYELINVSRPDTLDPEPDEAVLKVACQNYADFVVDDTVNTNVVILDDPGLLRSAELLDGPFAHSEAALLAEQALLNHDDDQDAALDELRSRSDFDETEVEEASQYFAARARPPTESASAEYVVYVVNVTTTRANIVRLPLRNELVRVPPTHASGAPLETQLPDGSVVGIAESACLLEADEA